MKTDMKNMFKGKNKLILALPIILILLFGTVLYLDKDNTAKASTSSSPVVMEPPVEETKAVREKIAAYEMEAKRQREEEEAEKESHIEEGDVFFSADEKREGDRIREERIARLRTDPYQRAANEYNRNKEYSTHAFASRISEQLNGLEEQEDERVERIRQESEEYYEKRMKGDHASRKKMYEEFLESFGEDLDDMEYAAPKREIRKKAAPAPEPEPVKEEEDDGAYEMPSTAIYTSEGKRYRRARINLPEQKNLIMAAIYGNQTVVNGSTVKMRLLEPVFTGGIEIPANTIFYGSAEIGTSRLRIKVSNIRYGSYMTPVDYLIFDSDAIEGLNLPASLKAEANQRIKEGMVQNFDMPISSIGTVASEVTSAISATTQIAKQVIGQSLSQMKVELKANYALFLKEDTQEDKKKRQAEDAELQGLYQQMMLQKNEPKKKNYFKKIIDAL